MEKTEPLPKFLKFTIDDEAGIVTKGAFPLPSPSAVGQRVIEVDSVRLQESLNRTLGGFLQLSDNLTLQGEFFEVSEVTLSLALDSSGEISILSLAKGAVTAKTGIEVVIKRRT